jgi:hypothetical protein
MHDSCKAIPEHFKVKPEELSFDLSCRNALQGAMDFSNFSSAKNYFEVCIEYLSNLESTQNSREIILGVIARIMTCPNLKKIHGIFKPRGELKHSLFTAKIIYQGLPPVSWESLMFD